MQPHFPYSLFLPQNKWMGSLLCREMKVEKRQSYGKRKVRQIPKRVHFLYFSNCIWLEKRVVVFGSHWNSVFPRVESSEWAVYILRWLHFSLQKNACLGASPTPAPALFPWPGPMSPPMVGVGGAVSTPWKCPSVPSSSQISLCTTKTSAAS